MTYAAARTRPWLSSKATEHLRDVEKELERIIDGHRSQGRVPAARVIDFHAAVTSELRSRESRPRTEEGPGGPIAEA